MTLFSKIIAGEIPSYKIAENDKFYAFLDISPAKEGHTLVIPKMETDRLFDLPEKYISGILSFAQPIANAIRQAVKCDRVNILTIGFEVPHAHIHLIPMSSMADVDITKKINRPTAEELKITQEKILRFL